MLHNTIRQKSGARILVIEDDRKVRAALCRLLKGEQYQVEEAETGEQALAQATRWTPDVILLDLGLPDMNGYDLFYQLTDHLHIPTIIVTCISEGHEAAELIRAGAIHYVEKPYTDETLLARIYSALKHDGSTLFSTGQLVVDFDRREVREGGRPIENLTPHEYSVLKYLAENAGRILEHNQILEHVWGYADKFTRDSLSVVIYQLRTKIEPQDQPACYIITKSGVGYGLAKLPS